MPDLIPVSILIIRNEADNLPRCLDGREGWYLARRHGFYEFLSLAKTYELKARQSDAADRTKS